MCLQNSSLSEQPGEGGDTSEAGKPTKSYEVIKKAEALELQVVAKLKEFVRAELEIQDNNQVTVAPVWTALQITRLMTKYPEESVPPPPIPPVPVPDMDGWEDDVKR